jgi:hypothetical protein
LEAAVLETKETAPRGALDVAGGVANGLTDADDTGRTLVTTGVESLCARAREHRSQPPGVDPSAATLNAWAYSTVR